MVDSSGFGPERRPQYPTGIVPRAPSQVARWILSWSPSRIDVTQGYIQNRSHGVVAMPSTPTCPTPTPTPTRGGGIPVNCHGANTGFWVLASSQTALMAKGNDNCDLIVTVVTMGAQAAHTGVPGNNLQSGFPRSWTILENPGI